ncbi:MAG: trigger factor [Candidatus Kerfeldbacteria bacterium]|nr:trigger factor [Candidatus Kerfeldbacteria bacterium]
MKVTSKVLPNTTAELTIELSVEEVHPFVQAAAKRISQEVTVKGFRKGHVPYDVLKQQVGEGTIYEEAFNALVQDSYPKAVDQEKLQTVGRANIDVEKIAPGNPVVYKATVPLMPKVALGEYKKLKSKKPAVELDQKKYDKTMAEIRKMRAKETLVDRAAAMGDKVLVDFEVKVDGVVIEGGQAQKQPIVLGDAQFIPGFEEAIVGMKKGEEKNVELSFPKEYKKDLAGKPAQFHLNVHDVYAIELPELNDEMAKEMNFESLSTMQEEIRKNIMRELEQAEQEKFEVAVIEEIVAKSTFDPLPDQLIDEEVDKMMREIEQDITRQGLKFDDYLAHMKKTPDELKKDFRDRAGQRIKAALVMREVAVAEKIEVDAAELQKEIDELKKLYDQIPDMISQIDSEAHRSRMENMMMHRKTFERLESFTK